MKKTTDRPRIEMGDAPEHAKKRKALQCGLDGDSKKKLYDLVIRIDHAVELCSDPAKTNSEIASAIGITRRQVSRLRHGCKMAWERLV